MNFNEYELIDFFSKEFIVNNDKLKIESFCINRNIIEFTIDMKENKIEILQKIGSSTKNKILIKNVQKIENRGNKELIINFLHNRIIILNNNSVFIEENKEQ